MNIPQDFIPIEKIRIFKKNKIISDISKKETDISENDIKVLDQNQNDSNFNEIKTNKNDKIIKNILLKKKPLFEIPINEIKKNFEENNVEEDKGNIIYFEIKDNENKSYNLKLKRNKNGKPNFYIPIDNIKKEFKEVEEIEKNNHKNEIIQIVNEKNVKRNEYLNKYSNNKFYQNLNSNIPNGINNNNFFSNFNNDINYYSNNHYIRNSNFLNYNLYNLYNLFGSNIDIIKLIEKKAEFQIMKDLGLNSLKNPKNVNHDLYSKIKEIKNINNIP